MRQRSSTVVAFTVVTLALSVPAWTQPRLKHMNGVTVRRSPGSPVRPWATLHAVDH